MAEVGDTQGCAERYGAMFLQGTDVGTQGPKDSAETHRHKQVVCLPRPPPQPPHSTYTSRRAGPLSLLPLSLALQQSSCSKLIEFSAWEGPGELRRGGGWEEAC